LKHKIIILLATFNGEKYIKTQLNSLKSQTYKNIEIIAKDDCSDDNTVNILQSYNITLLQSDTNSGPKKNFAYLLNYALKNCSSKYFMLCDQDDIWANDKVQKSLDALQKLENSYGKIPLLVHTDLEVVDEKTNKICPSFAKYQNINYHKNSFEKLLMQNTITGCTSIINRELAEISKNIPDEAIMHDWWIGLCAAYFGKINFINESTIRYRQHTMNTIGATRLTFINIIKKIFTLTDKSIDHNISQAKIFLKIFNNELDENTKVLLEKFININQKNFFEKRFFLIKNKLFKHGIIRNIGLFIKI